MSARVYRSSTTGFLGGFHGTSGSHDRDPVADRVGQLELRPGPKRLVNSGGGQEHRVVRVGAESRSLAPDFVHDDEIEMLRLELASSRCLEVVGLCGEPDQDTIALALSELPKDVGRRFQMKLGNARLLLEL